MKLFKANAILTPKSIFSILCLLVFGVMNVNAQCISIDEDDFNPGSICATETANAGPISTNILDVWDLLAGASGADGTGDIQFTYEAIVSNPNANGTCDDGDFSISAGWGGTGGSCGGTGTSDFAATDGDDCVCENGYIIMTVSFLNGFGSEVSGFDFDWSSINGGSEGYEYGFGFVSAATDAAGTPITGLNSVAALSNIATYCNPIYVGGTTVSQHVLTSTTGVFTNQGDDLNATPNDCATSGQNGEDTDTGTGANSGGDAGGVSGLAPTDVITEVIFVYGYSNAPGSDCDGDGDVGVGSGPSGSFSGIDICPPPPPCNYTFDANAVEDCGEFKINIENITGLGSAAGQNYDILVDGAVVLANQSGATQCLEDFTADGTTVYAIEISLAGDNTCISDPIMITSPVANEPSCGTYPANPVATFKDEDDSSNK